MLLWSYRKDKSHSYKNPSAHSLYSHLLSLHVLLYSGHIFAQFVWQISQRLFEIWDWYVISSPSLYHDILQNAKEEQENVTLVKHYALQIAIFQACSCEVTEKEFAYQDYL